MPEINRSLSTMPEINRSRSTLGEFAVFEQALEGNTRLMLAMQGGANETNDVTSKLVSRTSNARFEFLDSIYIYE